MEPELFFGELADECNVNSVETVLPYLADGKRVSLVYVRATKSLHIRIGDELKSPSKSGLEHEIAREWIRQVSNKNPTKK